MDFGFKTDQEIKKQIDDWFNDLEHIEKLRVLLRYYIRLNITMTESQGIGILWKKIPLEDKKNLYRSNWKH